MLRGKSRGALALLFVLSALLPMTACDKGPKRRGAQNYEEYRAMYDKRYRGAASDEGEALGSDDGDFGPASGNLDVTSADAIRSGNVPNSGSVKGKVTYAGAAVKVKEKDLSKDAWCANGHKVQDEDMIVASDGGLKNVLVFISKGVNRFEFQVPSKAVELDQNGCKYVPHVLTMMAGQELVVINSDATSHNYHFTGRANDEINKTQNTQGKRDIVSDLTSPELGASFRCDIHPWMAAPTHILAHPYYVLTDESGNFEIKGLPAGKYQVAFVHERSDMKTEPLEVTIETGKAAEITAQFQR